MDTPCSWLSDGQSSMAVLIMFLIGVSSSGISAVPVACSSLERVRRSSIMELSLVRLPRQHGQELLGLSLGVVDRAVTQGLHEAFDRRNGVQARGTLATKSLRSPSSAPGVGHVGQHDQRSDVVPWASFRSRADHLRELFRPEYESRTRPRRARRTRGRFRSAAGPDA